jgi:hypothetical protein
VDSGNARLPARIDLNAGRPVEPTVQLRGRSLARRGLDFTAAIG